MKSGILLIVLSTASAFAPTAFTSRSETSLAFFGGGAKKTPEPKKGGMDSDVFGGKGKRITVREDEDNAMWIEEDDKGNRKPAQGGGMFGFGKGKGK